MTQSWNPEVYARDARFVVDLAAPVVDLLAPRPGERILDLGCGDGTLTQRIAACGSQVVGIDSSPDMVAAAIRLGIDARVMDGQKLTFCNEFDAVFSNAALHWMTNPDAVIRGVAAALKPGGRFVGEFGGCGNVNTVITALRRSMEGRGMNADNVMPWYFPTADEYRQRLRNGGLRVVLCHLIPRPTVLDTDLRAWLRVFCQSFVSLLPAEEHEPFYDEVAALCRPQLVNASGKWVLDYVRLRFMAVKD